MYCFSFLAESKQDPFSPAPSLEISLSARVWKERNLGRPAKHFSFQCLRTPGITGATGWLLLPKASPALGLRASASEAAGRCSGFLSPSFSCQARLPAGCRLGFTISPYIWVMILQTSREANMPVREYVISAAIHFVCKALRRRYTVRSK